MKSLSFWKKKEPIKNIQEESLSEETPEKLVTKIEIFIHLRDGSIRVFNSIYPIDTIETCITCFYSFYKWFYFRESDSYTFSHKDGFVVFIRSEIKLFEVRKSIFEEEKV